MNNPNLNLADAAYTLQVGRKVFSHRLFFVCRDNQDAINILNGTAKDNSFFIKQEEEANRPVAFIFTGASGSLEIKGSELYQTEPCFRESVDRCADCLRKIIHMDLRHFMYPDLFPNEAGSIGATPETKRAALFIYECALTELWMGWGIKPQALYGLDWLGKCLAAYIAGVISLEDALKAVIAGKFAAADGIKLNVPQIKIVSGITKSWLSEKEATDISYWDRFGDNDGREALSGLIPDNRFVLLQIGQGFNLNSDNDAVKIGQ